MKPLAFSLCLAASIAFAEDAIRPGEELAVLPDGPGKQIQATPAVAFGGGTYLVAWREGWHGKGGASRIFGARISPEGKILDPRGIEIAPSRAGVQEFPRIAFGGGVFLVIWQDFRNEKDYDVFGARVSPEGKVLDAQPIPIGVGPRNQVLPDVASDGKNFLSVWQGLRGEETAFRGFAASISADGQVGQPIETGMTPQPRIAFSGAQYLVASGGIGTFAGNVNAIRLDAAGQPQGKPFSFIRGTKGARFSICPAGEGRWLLVSHRSPPDPWGWGGPGAIRVCLVNGDGQPAHPDAIKEPGNWKTRPAGWLDMGMDKKQGATWPFGENACAFDGARPVVVWQRHHLCGEKMTNFENCDLVAARVDQIQSLDPAGVPVAASPAEEKRPALASDNAGRLLLVYEKEQPEGTTICARLIQSR